MSATFPDDSTPSQVYNGTGFDDNGAVLSATVSESHTDWAGMVIMLFWIFAVIMVVAAIALPWWQSKKQETNVMVATVAGGAHTPEASIESDDVEKHQEQVHQHQHQDIVYIQPPPRSILLILPTLSALIALAFSIVPLASCKFIDVDSRDTRSIESLGIWSAYGYTDSSSWDKTCFSMVNNVDYYVDTPMVAARVFSVLATALGALAFMFLVCVVANERFRSGGRMVPSTIALILLAFVFQIATLVVQASHFCGDGATCYLEMGAVSAITASIYWIIALGSTVSFLLTK